MRVGAFLLFAPPDVTFDRLDFADACATVDAFVQRIEGFYLRPADALSELRHAFACGVLCCTAIDALGRYEDPRAPRDTRFEEWAARHILELRRMPSLAKRFHDDFRHGLVHEGRVKNGGQFSFETAEAVVAEDRVLIVNPDYLLPPIRSGLHELAHGLLSDHARYQGFARQLQRQFRIELATAGTPRAPQPR